MSNDCTGTFTPKSRPKRVRINIPTIYPSLLDQMAALGRRMEPVPPDGNCMFESIARQSHDYTENTHIMLRKLTCIRGRVESERFRGFLAHHKRDQYLSEINKLEKNGVWDIDIGDVAIMILQQVVNRKIVVLRNRQKPLIFPDDGVLINDDDLVILQDDFQTHYDSTRLLYWPDGKMFTNNCYLI